MSRRRTLVLDFVQIATDVIQTEPGQPVMTRRRLNIAVGAGQIAQCAGIEPQGVKVTRYNERAVLTLGRGKRALKLRGVKAGSHIIRRFMPTFDELFEGSPNHEVQSSSLARAPVSREIRSSS
jgi:hypothetical protein